MDETQTVPRFNELMWPTLRALDELGGSGSIQEIYDQVLEREKFSDQQLSVLHKNGPDTEIWYRLRVGAHVPQGRRCFGE
jgi:restriction system protein